ncbi:hypothetical protein ACEUBH_02490 [Aeromonas veronii]
MKKAPQGAFFVFEICHHSLHKAKQSKAKQSKAKQSKAKQSKAKQSIGHCGIGRVGWRQSSEQMVGGM